MLLQLILRENMRFYAQIAYKGGFNVGLFHKFLEWETKTQIQSKNIGGFSILLSVQGKPDKAHFFSNPKNYIESLSAQNK